MPGAVHEGVAPAGLGDDLPAGRVDVLGARPRPDRGHAGGLRGPDDLDHPGLGVVERLGPADRDRAGHVGVVAVDERAEVDDDEVAALDARGPTGVWCGPGAVGAGRDDRLEADVVGALAAHLGVELERERLPRWARPPASGATAARAASAMPHAASMRATSPSSFTRRSASTRPLVGTSSTPANHSSA